MLYSFTCSPKMFFKLSEEVYFFETMALAFKVTELRPLQPWNALLAMRVTLLGIVTEVRPEQPAKAPSLILVTLLGMVTEVRPEQYSKAELPILVTLLGMVMEVSPVHE